MAVATIEVPSRGHMAHGIGKSILYGVEYEVLDHNKVELTCADELKLAKIVASFKGKVLSVVNHKNVRVEMPRHEA